MKGASFKFKNHKWFTSSLDKSIQPKKQAQKSHATVPLSLTLDGLKSFELPSRTVKSFLFNNRVKYRVDCSKAEHAIFS